MQHVPSRQQTISGLSDLHFILKYIVQAFLFFQDQRLAKKVICNVHED